jgi:putative transcriptional regulator
MTVKSRLHILMGERKIKSINQLSTLTGITRPTLTRIYDDKAVAVELATIDTLCKFFGCDVGDILYFEGEND